MNNLRCRRHAWKHKEEDEDEEEKTRNDDSNKT